MEGHWRWWIGTVTLLTQTDVVIFVGPAHFSNCEWRGQHQQYTAPRMFTTTYCSVRVRVLVGGGW